MTSLSSLDRLEQQDAFTQRHLGPTTGQQKEMLAALNLDSLDALTEQAVPASIRLDDALAMAEGVSEAEATAELAGLAAKNSQHRSLIGMGYYGTLMPAVIQRNVLENPAWYTAYTPYQPEISQGRLEGLLNFQQMVMDLTGMDIANASLLDEATAAGEAMSLCRRSNRKKSDTFFVADNVHPQTLDVLKTRAHYFGFKLVVDSADKLDQYDSFGVLVQYPGSNGEVVDLEPLIAKARAQKAMVCVASDLLALVLLKSPGSLGADVVFGSAQRFGVPMGFGGPHAAFFAATDKLKRSIPGRIIGVSVDSRGEPALRMAMQTREQHIRREKATSNICTAQALLANLAGFYAVYHGPDGLKTIAERVHRLAAILAVGLKQAGFSCNETFFDTLNVEVDDADIVINNAEVAGFNLRRIDPQHVGVSLDETVTRDELTQLLTLFGASAEINALDAQVLRDGDTALPAQLRRQDVILEHPVFHGYHSETDMMRYLKQLESKDYSLVHGMIPLGSCTMKLNAAAEMMPITWPGFAALHPFAPVAQAAGYLQMISQLEAALVEITGYDAVSMQPNSGAQGEYAGLVTIRRYQQSIGEGHRHICLIPSSAHGTNPASAVMAGMEVVIVDCDNDGNVDVADLSAKAEQYSGELSALMITYPSTHGIYEEAIVEICQIVHKFGGQVYMDGANLNAQVGISKPGLIGSDVSHLNLHKTFAIPHGGGGPGMGPIGVKKHLIPFLPGHSVTPIHGQAHENSAVSAAAYGSGSILPISWMYIRMLGRNGLKKSSQVAILNANYLAQKLSAYYPVLYRGRNGRVAHECIVDIRPLKQQCGVSEEDIAKRLMDYGFHAPTMSFPVPGTLMIEPTESESKGELDRFIEAMAAIRGEISRVESGEWSLEQSPLHNAPHTQADIAGDWTRCYSIAEAVLPTEYTRKHKFWPAVNRIDNVYGDRHLFCSCPAVESYKN